MRKTKRTNENKDIYACIAQMPPDMKQRIVDKIESELGMTVSEYKEKQFKATELLIADVKENPGAYTTARLNRELSGLLRGFDEPDELKNEIMRIKMFISHRNTVIFNTDGSVERNADVSYEEFSKDWTRE